MLDCGSALSILEIRGVSGRDLEIKFILNVKAEDVEAYYTHGDEYKVVTWKPIIHTETSTSCDPVSMSVAHKGVGLTCRQPSGPGGRGTDPCMHLLYSGEQRLVLTLSTALWVLPGGQATG